ncbi:membrane protein insertion efficiency factor YidD [Undibacterium terreum]|uniref:Putative membrane protein insertion efficiency factor n=1 Tax=Undibacterium terreum TaxID=1224302 RepID=A0A916UZU1_9BURK|nr:hypothetical protein GCM10011396_49620 [Undibacterium terreum]
MKSPVQSLLTILLRGYQLGISPMLGQNCRFYPTCSNYAIEAIRVHGAARGSLLAGKRLCKCHPWHPGGIDMVPGSPGAEAAGEQKKAENQQVVPTSDDGSIQSAGAPAEAGRQRPVFLEPSGHSSPFS